MLVWGSGARSPEVPLGMRESGYRTEAAPRACAQDMKVGTERPEKVQGKSH